MDSIIASFPTVITCLQAVTSASFEFYTSLICDVRTYVCNFVETATNFGFKVHCLQWNVTQQEWICE